MFLRNKLDPLIRSGACIGTLLMLLIAGNATAGAIYKCVDASGAIAFQAAPCVAPAAQTAMQVRGQPLLDADAPASAIAEVSLPAQESAASFRRSRAHTPARRGSHRKRAQTTSWECRAADGEVFYRHTRCPHSVPGDGAMRSDGAYAVTRGRTSRSRARSAWDPVPVHARKVSRLEACRQINAPAAVDRDGHARDEQVSVYEHDLGRDPCSGQ